MKRQPSAEHPAKTLLTIFHSHFGFKVVRIAAQMRLQYSNDSIAILNMHQIHPLISYERRGWIDTDHLAPARREVELIGDQVPIPNPIVGALDRK